MSLVDPAVAADAIRVAPIVFSDRTLANGLRAIVVEDHRVPSAAINVGYRVGGKDDPPGRSGFAHLFEHLMFKGTARTGAETIDRLTEDVGGFNNAFTAEDITNYYEVVPSNYVETLLWAEADRLASLAVTEANFHTEREVVVGEYDQRILAEPYGMLGEIVERTAFEVHPYGRGVIGNPDQLRAATLEDVVAFHRTYYRPDNAVLVVTGDVDGALVETWIDRYFGGIERPASPIPRVAVVEPPQTAERRTTYRAANVPLPALEAAYHIPAATHPDAAALDVLEIVLGAGRSSRLHRELVYRSRLCSSAWANSDTREQPGLFSIRAVANGGVGIDEVAAALDVEIDRIRSGVVEPGELARARTQIASYLIRARQTNHGVGLALVRSAVERGDPGLVNEDLRRYLAVEAADIQRVAATYLDPANRSVVEYTPAA